MIPVVIDLSVNDEQLKAITSDAKKILCLAGAGTGKTTTLTSRIANLNKNRISCRNMLALTFTRLAGKEMKERVIKIVGKQEGSKLFCNTFHAFCAEIIREHGHFYGFDADFSIYDEEDSKAIIQEIINDYSFKKAKVDEVFSLLRNPLLENSNLGHTEDSYLVYEEFLWRLEQNNSLDFDSLIHYAIDLLKKPEIQKVYHDRYTYVFVDEFQDTNDEQWKLIELLNPEYLFCVGDDFQAIYGWRGANINIILNLAGDPEWEVIKLETNYRSSRNIIEASNNLILNNKQTQKILKASKDQGESVVKMDFESDAIEAKRVVESSQLFYNNSEIAVLARTNAQLNTLKDAFDENNIQCTILSNDDDVFKKNHIKSLLSVMNVCINPKNNYAFIKAVNFPERRLTEMQIKELQLISTQKESCLFKTLNFTDLNKELLDIFDAVNKLENFNTLEVYWKIVDVLNLISLYKKSGLNNRIEDLYQASEKIGDWESSQHKTCDSDSPSEFLKWLKLKDIQENLIKKTNAVKLMTVHGSKGLEFDVVYIVGLNEDLFPSSRGDIEEERRLMYVAMTRAKSNLFISSTRTRNCRGQTLWCSPSRFLKELG